MLELNKIYNMDCIEWMKLIPDWSIDCIITDPPYWTTACKWDIIIPFDLMREQLKRIIKPNGAIVLFWSEPFSSALRMSNIKMYKYDWIWDKVLHSNPLIAKKQPLSANENISIFYKKQTTYNPQMEEWKEIKRWVETVWESWTKWNAKIFRWKNSSKQRYPKRIITISNANKKNIIHPTQKPVALLEYLIKTYTNEWETVLDFTMWSGTTAIACINTNRNFIWFELDKWYFDIANERISCKINTLIYSCN